MDECKIDATIDALRLQYEQNKGFVVYRNAGRYFATPDAFEWWVYRIEQQLIELADDRRGQDIEEWYGILDRQFQNSI